MPIPIPGPAGTIQLIVIPVKAILDYGGCHAVLVLGGAGGCERI